MASGTEKLANRADRIKARYLAAVNRNDMAEALQIGVDDLLPVSEELANRDAQFLNPLGITLRNLSAISHHLRRQIAQFYFAQRSLHVAVEIEPAGYALHHGLEDIAGVTATIATQIAGKGVSRVGPADRDLLVPAAAMIPRSMEIMMQLDSKAWAAQLRLAATALRKAAWTREPTMVDCETQAIVWLARISRDIGERTFAVEEIRRALLLWIDELGSTSRYWSRELEQTWTVAADVLDSLRKREAAAELRAAIDQAAARHGRTDLTGLANILDVRHRYEAAAIALERG
ncbi:hypothetical protein ACQPYA_11920 [Micromonospora sp. CA-263727]|uniref:hypothetical protein n=1 Tax=Micromonospora sp. CA-263727 TaxID=3239967 RepID=UPI003D8F2B60